MRTKISREGWAAIYELCQIGIPRKSIAIEFGIDYDYMNEKLAQFEREGIRE